MFAWCVFSRLGCPIRVWLVYLHSAQFNWFDLTWFSSVRFDLAVRFGLVQFCSTSFGSDWLGSVGLVQISPLIIWFGTMHPNGWFHVSWVVAICKNRFWLIWMKLTNFSQKLFHFCKTWTILWIWKGKIFSAHSLAYMIWNRKWNKYANLTVMLIKTFLWKKIKK